MTFTHGSLFTGIGGFDLAFERAGVPTLWQVEKDAAARSVLAYHWPDVQRFDDICTVGTHNLEYVDILSGGFPCQNLSVAGRHEGLTGAQSGLYWEMVRIIDEIKPRIVLWENVPGLLSSDKGRDFGRVLGGMADIGYVGSYRILNAQYFGVAQRRRRVFGVFARGDIGADCCRQILAVTESVSGYPESGKKKGKDVAYAIRASTASRGTDDPDRLTYIPMVSKSLRGQAQSSHREDSQTFIPMVYDTTQVTSKANRSNPLAGAMEHPLAAGAQPPLLVSIAFSSKDYGADAGEIAPTLRAMNFDKSHADGGGQVAIATSHAVRRLTPRECERLQGYDDDWTLNIVSGKQQADSPRYRQLGNSVAVPCVEWIARRIVKTLSETK